MRVTVKAYARLHFGFLNLSRELGWNYGSVGVGVDAPRITLVATPAMGLKADGPHSERMLKYAERLGAHYNMDWHARLEALDVIPGHSGLGSGTQWALAVGMALLRLHGLKRPPREVAHVLGRGGRSGIGISSFETGGFILETGHKPTTNGESESRSQVVMRRDFPEGWRFVLVMADASPGLSGKAECDAFASLGDTRSMTDTICRMVLLQLLPALVEQDIAAFGKAMSEVDRQTGLYFSKTQGGAYRVVATEMVAGLHSAGAHGVGQSSWGPCLYALVDDSNEQAVIRAAHEQLAVQGLTGTVFVARAKNTGAEIMVEE